MYNIRVESLNPILFLHLLILLLLLILGNGCVISSRDCVQIECTKSLKKKFSGRRQNLDVKV